MSSKLPKYSVDSVSAVSSEVVATQTWQRCNADEGVDYFPERFAWFYLHNPAGAARVYLLREEATGQFVGMLAVSCRQLILNGRPCRGALLHDFVVAHAHRTIYPALQLQRAARAQALLESRPIYGLPAHSALPVFRRLKSNVVVSMPRYVRVVRSESYLAQIVPRWLVRPLSAILDMGVNALVSMRNIVAAGQGEWVEAVDARFDDIWQASNKALRVMGVRDSEFLQWRFFAHPQIRYRALLAGVRGMQRPHTYFMCEQIEESLVVKDVLTSGSQSEFRSALLVLAREARKLSIARISVQMRPSELERRALQLAGFQERDARSCFITWGQPCEGVLDGVDWYLTPADEDV